MDKLQRRVLDFIRRRGLFQGKERVVIAFSGGPDSVALALILAELAEQGCLPLGLLLAHLNHCLRGAESDRDEAFCRLFAQRHSLDIQVERADVTAVARSRRLSVEAAARSLRYGFLGRVASDAGATAIATAHHADDVAETVLLRILRGAGIRGLGALPPSRPFGAEHPGLRVVRPLLEIGKSELLALLHSRGEPFCIDSSNLSTDRARNWVRHDLIPLLERECPTFSARSLCALNASALKVSRFLEEALDEIWPTVCRSAGNEEVALDQKALAEAPEPLRKVAADRALGILSRPPGCPPALGFEHYEKLVALARREVGTQVLLPGGFLARREHGLVYFSRLSSALPLPIRRLNVPGRVELPEVGMSIACARTEGTGPEEAARRAGASEVFLSPEETGEPLLVRSRRPGDRFHPLGAPGPARLKKFLIGRKVPLHQRDRIPLVTTQDGEIAWVVGHRIGERFKLREPAGCALRLTAHLADP